MSDTKKQSNNTTMQYFVGALGVVALILAGAVVILLLRPVVVVTNFEQCKEVSGSLLESYPEQCLVNGTTFTNSAQVSSDNDYVGLSEAAALAKAKQSNTPARVVERDGQPLPATMDFREGRLNLTVTDGKVTKVNIEGQSAAE